VLGGERAQGRARSRLPRQNERDALMIDGRVLRRIAVVLGALCGGCMTVTPQTACEGAAGYARRCDPHDCAPEEAQTRCERVAESYRGEYLAAVSGCFTDELACGDAGEAALLACRHDALAMLVPTQAHRDLADLLCGTCSLLGSSVGSNGECIRHFLPVASSDAAPSFPLGALKDASVASLRACLEAISEHDIDACAPAQACLEPLTAPLLADAPHCR
jgi:hypothetical protein